MRADCACPMFARFILPALVITIAPAAALAALPALDASLGIARVRGTDTTLTVSTGTVERVWRVTPQGLHTTSLRRLDGSPTSDETAPDATACDWNYPGVIGPGERAELVALTAMRSDD